MTGSGFLLSTTAFKSLSRDAQKEVLASIGLPMELNDKPSAAAHDGTTVRIATDGEVPVELTVAMVRKLTANLSEKTLNALKVIAQSNSPRFHMKDVIDATTDAHNYMDMRGVWAALTRRTRSITDDSGADLIWWTGEFILDDQGNYVDHIGEVSPMTYKSLRAHFGF